MKHNKFLPLFVACITLGAAYNIFHSIHSHATVGIIDVFLAFIGCYYFVTEFLRWMKR